MKSSSLRRKAELITSCNFLHRADKKLKITFMLAEKCIVHRNVVPYFLLQQIGNGSTQLASFLS